mmetsp:Transcript_56522/g.105987  ORF Transcript_56522/g.105987 Transcript_56522/m.105987 type:complete len:214 (+) Transcript_56522:335-976(+)
MHATARSMLVCILGGLHLEEKVQGVHLQIFGFDVGSIEAVQAHQVQHIPNPHEVTDSHGGMVQALVEKVGGLPVGAVAVGLETHKHVVKPLHKLWPILSRASDLLRHGVRCTHRHLRLDHVFYPIHHGPWITYPSGQMIPEKAVVEEANCGHAAPGRCLFDVFQTGGAESPQRSAQAGVVRQGPHVCLQIRLHDSVHGHETSRPGPQNALPFL